MPLALTFTEGSKPLREYIYANAIHTVDVPETWTVGR